MSGIQSPEDHIFTTPETEYLEKVDWLWQRLSPTQKSRVVRSVTNGTLRQGSGKHCFIAEAINANKVKTSTNNRLFDKFIQLVSSIFYDGPSFDFLFETKITPYDRKKLNDIYYARIGNRDHQYQKSTELIKSHISRHLITIK